MSTFLKAINESEKSRLVAQVYETTTKGRFAVSFARQWKNSDESEYKPLKNQPSFKSLSEIDNAIVAMQTLKAHCEKHPEIFEFVQVSKVDLDTVKALKALKLDNKTIATVLKTSESVIDALLAPKPTGSASKSKKPSVSEEELTLEQVIAATLKKLEKKNRK